MKKKRVLGIDSDSFHIGWFLADADRSVPEYGTINLGGRSMTFDQRIEIAIVQVRGLLLGEGPDVVAVELPYLGLNVQTTIKLAQIVGIIRALAWVSVAEFIGFQPAEGKMALSSNGRATDDEMVSAMRMVLLGEFGLDVDESLLDPHMAHAMGGFEFAKAELWRRSL